MSSRVVDHFAILGLTPNASDREIKEAYRRLAKQYHPDSNPDSEAAHKMKQLNQAKAVLFDPVKREEHRVRLSLGEKFADPRFTAEQIRAFRNKPSSIPNYRPVPRGAHSSWSKEAQKKFTIVVAGLFVFLIAMFSFGLFNKGEGSPLPPIEQIIQRHSQREAKLEIPEKPIKIDDDTLPVLREKAKFLLQFGEYNAAGQYLQKCLEKDSSDEGIIRDLSLSYFKQGKYAKSLQVLSKQMHGDSNLVAAYYNVGEMFLSEGKPFDARNSFQEVVRIGESMPSRDEQTLVFVRKARERLHLD